jgi:chemotaxis receptor (MCP) glutamine deamidase CheD
MAGVTENYSKLEVSVVVRFLQAEGVSQREIHCRLVFTARMFSAEQKCLCGAINLKMAEQH